MVQLAPHGARTSSSARATAPPSPAGSLRGMHPSLRGRPCASLEPCHGVGHRGEASTHWTSQLSKTLPRKRPGARAGRRAPRPRRRGSRSSRRAPSATRRVSLSPVNGSTKPAASPTRSQPGPATSAPRDARSAQHRGSAICGAKPLSLPATAGSRRSQRRLVRCAGARRRPWERHADVELAPGSARGLRRSAADVHLAVIGRLEMPA